MRVSVIGSGMGIPACAIYATELARVFGVRRMVRMGTCGGIGDIELGDILVAQAASTDSNFNRLNFGGHELAACDDFELTRAVLDTARVRRQDVRLGGAFSTYCFYAGDPQLTARIDRKRTRLNSSH